MHFRTKLVLRRSLAVGEGGWDQGRCTQHPCRTRCLPLQRMERTQAALGRSVNAAFPRPEVDTDPEVD